MLLLYHSTLDFELALTRSVQICIEVSGKSLTSLGARANAKLTIHDKTRQKQSSTIAGKKETRVEVNQ
jgi:hypothetical protein